MSEKVWYFQCEGCYGVFAAAAANRRYCGECERKRHNAGSRAWHHRNRDRILAAKVEYRRANREWLNQKRRVDHPDRDPGVAERKRVRDRAYNIRRRAEATARVDERPSTRHPKTEQPWPYLDTPLPYAYDSHSLTIETILLGDPLDILIAHRMGRGYDETGLSELAR